MRNKNKKHSTGSLSETTPSSGLYNLLIRYCQFLQGKISRNFGYYDTKELETAGFSEAERRTISEHCTSPKLSAQLASRKKISEGERTPQQRHAQNERHKCAYIINRLSHEELLGSEQPFIYRFQVVWNALVKSQAHQ